MLRTTSTPLLLALLLSCAACDDPAPIVLGRLQASVRDAGHPPDDDDDDEHARESEREPAAGARAEPSEPDDDD